MPGQATSYKTGMMHILRLRRKAMDSMGDAFSLRQFHGILLENGSVPLEILDEIVKNYIVSSGGEAGRLSRGEEPENPDQRNY